jgi:hypothetical protein
MIAYEAEVEITTTWSIEVDAEDEAAAEEAIKGMNYGDIEAAGNFSEVVDIEVVDIELAYTHEEEDEDE